MSTPSSLHWLTVGSCFNRHRCARVAGVRGAAGVLHPLRGPRRLDLLGGFRAQKRLVGRARQFRARRAYSCCVRNGYGIGPLHIGSGASVRRALRPRLLLLGPPPCYFSESAFGATARARGRSLEVDCEFFGQKERRCLRQQLRSGNRPGLEDGRQSESKATYFSELPSCASASVESESSRWVASLVFNRENNNGGVEILSD